MWDYEHDAELREAITARDLIRLRSIVNGELMKDPTDSNRLAIKALEYIRSSVPEILAQHEERSQMLFDKSKWDENYYDLMDGALMNNFSEKRFLHVLEVGQHVYSSKAFNINGTPTLQNRNKGVKLLIGSCCCLVLGVLLMNKDMLVGAILIIVSIVFGVYALMKGK